MEALIALGADKDSQDPGSGVRPMHDAARGGQVEVVRVLIALGANKEAQTYEDARPLHDAANNGHVEVVRVLVATGADYEAPGPNGNRPLHIAAAQGHLEVVRVLIAAGADKDAHEARDRATPLHMAASHVQVEVVDILVQLGADLDAQNAAGETPLAISLQFGLQYGDLTMYRLLEAAARSRSTAATGAGTCAACGGSSPSGARLKTCARCQSVKYCSVDCQRTHWSVHKASCAAAAAARSGEANSAQESGHSSTRATGSTEPSASTHAAAPSNRTASSISVVSASSAAAAATAFATMESTQRVREMADRMAAVSIEEAAAGSSAAGSSDGARVVEASSGSSARRPASAGLHTTQGATQPVLPIAEATSGAQQPDPQPQPAGSSSKMDKARQRHERNKQRKIEQASVALQWAMEAIEEHGVRCVCALTRRLPTCVQLTGASY